VLFWRPKGSPARSDGFTLVSHEEWERFKGMGVFADMQQQGRVITIMK
jgi:hypothetical protein